MKVDTINTIYGDIDVDYSTFKKGFFLKSLPAKLHKINGLQLLTSRDNSFEDYKKLEAYVREVVNNSLIDFDFKRKVIIYKIDTTGVGFEEHPRKDALSFEFMACDEAEAIRKVNGIDKTYIEYYCFDSNIPRRINKRDRLWKIADNDENFNIIDYDEKTHEFFKSFTSSFESLKKNLISFFDKEEVVSNIINQGFNINVLPQQTKTQK